MEKQVKLKTTPSRGRHHGPRTEDGFSERGNTGRRLETGQKTIHKNHRNILRMMRTVLLDVEVNVMTQRWGLVSNL